MVRCVVKSCKNRNETSLPAQVSFFRFPENAVMREGWIQKIGECRMTKNIKSAKICSAHFTEDSFVRSKKTRLPIRRRNLLPSAVPTLLLSETENSDNESNMDFKVIFKDFPLSVIHENVKAESSELLVSPDDASNVQECTIDVESPKGRFRSNLEEKRLEETNAMRRTPPTSVSCDYVHGATFPTRSENEYCRRNVRHVGKMKKRQNTSKRKINFTSEEIVETLSEENTPPWKRKQRFMLENCTTICDNTISMTQDSEPSVTIEWLNSELQHSKSVCDYYKQSKSTDLENLKMKQEECESLKLVLQQKNEEIQNLRKEMEEHRNAYKDLQEKLTAANIVENICDKAVKEKVKEALKPYFTEGQIRCILEQDRKWIHWSIDDYASAISLRSISPKTYTYLRLKLNYPLPSLSSLRRWALKKFDIQEGFLHDVLAVMREKGKQLTEFERIAVVTFDEMSLSPEVCFDSKIEKLIGPCKKVQVIMVRGLFSKWKQPIYYKFDQPMTKSILLEAAKHLYDAGYMIVAVTSDMGNKGVWKELNISPTKYWFEHPVKKDTKIFVFADVPHLLKLLRNWFIDDGCLLPNCKEPFTAAVFQSIIDMNKAGDLHVAHRLTQRILDARNTLRQAVRPAAQIWSHTSAKAIKWAGQRGLLNNKEYSKFSDFVEVVNDWFDVHNSQLKYGAHPGVNGFGVDLKKQQQTLMLMNFYIENMKVGSRKVMMPFQKGILISNSSLRELYDELKSTHQQFEYIMTRRLQQDILENFFAYIRAMGSSKDHPSGYDFRYRLRWYILGKHSHAVFTMNRNTEEDESASCISSCSTDNVSSLSTAPKTPSTPVIATISSAVTPTSVPSTSMHMHSSTPLQKIKLFAPEYIDTTDHEFSCSEINNDHSEDEIILTKELFENIINISPEELKEDSRSNELIDEDRADDFEINELFTFMQGASVETLSMSAGCQNATDIVQEEGLQYVAGYVAHRFKRKYPHLGERTGTSNNTAEESWLKVVSKGRLICPSIELIRISRLVDRYFQEFHGDYFSKEDFVIQKVVALVKTNDDYNESIPEEVLQCLVRTRTYIRVRDINKRAYTQNDERRKQRKMKKIKLNF